MTRLYAISNGAGANRYTSNPNLQIGDYTPNSGSAFTPTVVNIMNYSNNTTYKTVISRSNNPTDWVSAIAALWSNTNAINQITIRMGAGNNILAGSSATIYGVKAA